MADFNAVAKEVFQVLRSFNYTVRLYNDDSMAVTEPEDARRFVAYPKNLMVSLLDDDDNSRITLSMGKSTRINDVMGLDQQLRTLATKYNMIFRAQHHGKHINPKHFARVVSVTEGKDSNMQICEGLYGTSRSSYLRLAQARMIVRHDPPIDSQPGARGRRVAAIFVETAAGQRRQMPTSDLLAGRALTQHVNRQGSVSDPVARQIIRMAEDYRHLGIAVRAAVTAPAAVLREACRCKQAKLRKTLQKLARPASYAAEAATLQATTRSEPVTARIDEVRRLLSGTHSPAVYETCCTALHEARQEATVSVVGHAVTSAAWEAFKQHVLDLKRRPNFQPLNFPSMVADIAYRLSHVAQVVKDDSMSNLLAFVADRLPEETDKPLRDKYRLIAVNALRAVDAMPNRLAARNATVVEHIRWLRRFDPDRVLLEFGSGIDPMDPDFPDEQYDRAEEMALTDFDPEYFIESPEMQDVISGRDPHDPEQNELERDEIVSGLATYLRHYIETYNPDFVDGYNPDTDALVPAVYDQTVKALQQRGFVIIETNLAEAAHSGEELTIEDVLLPSPNKGADLAAEVTKADVVDPIDQGHGKPDGAYTSRLMTLAGMRTGVV